MEWIKFEDDIGQSSYIVRPPLKPGVYLIAYGEASWSAAFWDGGNWQKIAVGGGYDNTVSRPRYWLDVVAPEK